MGLSSNMRMKAKVVIASTLMLSVILSMMIFSNYIRYRDDFIRNEQDRLLTIAETIARTIENTVENYQNGLLMLARDDSVRDLLGKSTDGVSDQMSDKIEMFLKTQTPGLERLEFYSTDNALVGAHPSASPITQGDGTSDVLRALNEQKQIVSPVYFDANDNPFIYLDQPVWIGEDVIGVIRAQLSVNTIYRYFVEPINPGNKGYASVKTSGGKFIMHPRKDQLGQDVLSIRKQEYPDYDWSALQEMFDRQMRGEKGSGIYQSVWVTEKKPEPTLKFNGYSPAKIGDDFWIVTVSSDYEEATKYVRENFYGTIRIMATIGFFGIFASLYVYSLLMKQKKLEAEAVLLGKVRELNIELEKDINERKILENELRESRRKFVKLFNTGSHITFVLNVPKDSVEGFEILEVNDYACERLGYPHDALIQMNYSDVDATFNKALADQIMNANPDIEQFHYETNLRASDASEFPAEIYTHCFEIDNKAFLMFVARDITEKKMNEEALERNRGLMIYRARLAAMGEMIANIAHQWRQPLSSLNLIISNIEDAYDHGELDESYFRNQVESTQNIIQQMSGVIDDFLFFFNPKDEKALFDASAILRGSLEMIKDRIDIYEIDIHIECEDGILLNGYPSQLSQVLLNILNNSVDALKSRDLHRRIEIGLFRNQDGLIIKIHDNGGGIAEADLPHVFDPYFSTKGKEEGTGIGLYITKMIIERNFGGELRIANQEGGLLTKIVLPEEA